MLKAVNIVWDTTEECEDILSDLPAAIDIPEDLSKEYKNDRSSATDKISDYLSEATGFCHFGFDLVES